MTYSSSSGSVPTHSPFRSLFQTPSAEPSSEQPTATLTTPAIQSATGAAPRQAWSMFGIAAGFILAAMSQL
jgi:hypothetical protein